MDHIRRHVVWPVVVLFLVVAGAVQAETVVNFDCSGVTASVSTVRTADVDFIATAGSGLESQQRYNFGTASADAFFDPTALAAQGIDQNIYGGTNIVMGAYDTGTPLLRALQLGVSNSAGYAYFSNIGISGNTDPTPPGMNWTGLFMFRKDEFLNGGDAGTTFDATSSMSVTYGYWSDWNVACRTRMVIRNGSTYYLSEAYFTSYQNATLTLDDFNNNDAADKRWAIWTPTATSFAIPDTSGMTFEAVDFNDVTEVGFIAEGGLEKYNKTIRFASFIVDGVVIPEPVTISMLAVGAVGLLRRRRHP